MDLSVNPLSEGHKNHLNEATGLLHEHYNKSQYSTDIIQHLEESILYLYHILPKSHVLQKDKIYDKLNAQTLGEVMPLLLKDVEQKSGSNKYDFRTIELARMLFNVSSNYLLSSPLWQDTDFVTNDVDKISTCFQKLSENGLDKESHETIN